MKKLFGLILVFGLLFQMPAFAVSEWDITEIAGTHSASDIDAYSIVNAQAQDRLLIGYRKGLGINYSTAATLSALTGEIAIPNSDGSVTRYRRLTTVTSITWAMIDTGAEASSTTYYVYALGDTAATAPTFCISTNSSTPSGKTYYTKIAQFYNDSSSNITNVLNYRTDYGTDYADVAKGWINFNGDGTAAINDQFNVSSITDNGTGDYTISWATSFSSTSYTVVGTAYDTTLSVACSVVPTSKTISTVRILVEQTDNASDTDAEDINVVAFGDRT